MTALTFELERLGPFPVDSDREAIRRARDVADVFYRSHGRKGAPARLLSQTGKLEHSEGVALWGLQLRPGDASGIEVCPWRTAGCTAACVLETSFRGKSDGVRDGRDLRTLFLAEHPAEMILLIGEDLRRLVRKYGRVGFRPNIASDIRWEYVAPDLFGIPGVFGYDYTKANPLKHRGSIPNYRLTYSVSETALSEAIGDAYVRAGGNAAVVVRTPKHATPDTWRGLPAIDGDLTDDRTADPRGCYVMLASKADGKSDTTGFVKTLELRVA